MERNSFDSGKTTYLVPEDKCPVRSYVPSIDRPPVLVGVVKRRRGADALRERDGEFTCEATGSHPTQRDTEIKDNIPEGFATPNTISAIASPPSSP